jgi:hypothetical protein
MVLAVCRGSVQLLRTDDQPQCVVAGLLSTRTHAGVETRNDCTLNTCNHHKWMPPSMPLQWRLSLTQTPSAELTI